MNRLFIKNGNVVKSNTIENCTLVIEDGKITDNNYHGEIPVSTSVIDAKGLFVTPGFVEIHVHGGGGYDFMDATDEAFEQIAKTHLSHGTTSIMPTTVACDFKAMSRLFLIYRRQCRKSDITYLGLHLEGPYISQEMRGAQNPSYIHNPSVCEIDRLMCEAGDIIKMCTAAPEINGIEYMADRMLKNNIVLSLGHSDATYELAEKGYNMGFKHITHLYSNTPSVRKINQVVYAGIREAAYLLDDMRIELIGDGHHVPKEILQLALKIKGADKINLTSDAMRAAGTNVPASFLGEIKPENRVIIEDGVAKLPDRSFYAGSITTGDKMLKWAVNKCEISMCDAIKMLSLTPATIAGVNNRKGTLDTGKDADILLIDKELNIHTVITSGYVRKDIQL